jgi:tRNA(adenine34) deaminase
VQGRLGSEPAKGLAIRDGDVSRHAEVIALSDARKTLGRKALRGATLYTNVEPCAMCSFCLREAQDRRQGGFLSKRFS